MVKAGGLGDALTGVLGSTGELQGLGKVETDGGTHLLGSLGVGSTKSGLTGSFGLFGDSSSYRKAKKKEKL